MTPGFDSRICINGSLVSTAAVRHVGRMFTINVNPAAVAEAGRRLESGPFDRQLGTVFSHGPGNSELSIEHALERFVDRFDRVCSGLRVEADTVAAKTRSAADSYDLTESRLIRPGRTP